MKVQFTILNIHQLTALMTRFCMNNAKAVTFKVAAVFTEGDSEKRGKNIKFVLTFPKKCV